MSESYEHYAKEFYERRERVGFPLVRELSEASDEERRLLTKMTTEYLLACSSNELRMHADSLDHLYAGTQITGDPLRVNNVDVFGRAMLIALENNVHLDELTAYSLGHIVLKARYMTGDPLSKPFPFSFEDNYRLLFAGD